MHSTKFRFVRTDYRMTKRKLFYVPQMFFVTELLEFLPNCIRCKKHIGGEISWNYCDFEISFIWLHRIFSLNSTRLVSLKYFVESNQNIFIQKISQKYQERSHAVFNVFSSNENKFTTLGTVHKIRIHTLLPSLWCKNGRHLMLFVLYSSSPLTVTDVCT